MTVGLGFGDGVVFLDIPILGDYVIAAGVENLLGLVGVFDWLSAGAALLFL